MDILIVGTGYVGLVTGACFAEMGNRVICLDLNGAKVAALKEGEIPIFEPGLKDLVERGVAAERLSFTTSYAEGVAGANICFLALPTPCKEDGSCDLSYLEAATKSIAREMTEYKLIVNKSTAPVGTTQAVRGWVEEVQRERGVSIPFDVASNPEFLKEGAAIADFMKPDRVVLGCDSEKAERLLRNLYSAFTLRGSERILSMDPASAELSKYASNAMLALRISFMNEMAALCERLGASIHEVRKAVGLDPRIGPQFLYAGAGFGGSCFPKDVAALSQMARACEAPTLLIQAVELVNQKQKRVLGEKLELYFVGLGGLAGKRIAVWGLSFKPDTDDIREASSLTLLALLLERQASIAVYDPVASSKVHALYGEDLDYATTPYEAAEGADAVVLVTEWRELRCIDLEKLAGVMRGKAFFDGRNQYDEEEMARAGLDYFGIGCGRSLLKNALLSEPT